MIPTVEVELRLLPLLREGGLAQVEDLVGASLRKGVGLFSVLGSGAADSQGEGKGFGGEDLGFGVEFDVGFSSRGVARQGSGVPSRNGEERHRGEAKERKNQRENPSKTEKRCRKRCCPSPFRHRGGAPPW